LAHDLKTCMRIGGIAPPILTFGFTWSCVAKLKVGPHKPGKESLVNIL
jgi:hypothetical protein